jgi:hypothetical protein
MEKVYPRVLKTEVPQVFLRDLGPGRVVYFPWDIDRTFWEVLSVDHFKLLRNAVTSGPRTKTRPSPSLVPVVLDVTVWRQKARSQFISST